MSQDIILKINGLRAGIEGKEILILPSVREKFTPLWVRMEPAKVP